MVGGELFLKELGGGVEIVMNRGGGRGESGGGRADCCSSASPEGLTWLLCWLLVPVPDGTMHLLRHGLQEEV